MLTYAVPTSKLRCTMKIFSLMKLADIFTVGNLCCGILSILLAIDGYFELSASLLFLRWCLMEK